MTKRDEAILSSVGMTLEEVDAIAHACEEENYSMWDDSHVSYASPFKEEMTTVSVRLHKSRIEAINRIIKRDGLSRSEFIRRAIDQELITSGNSKQYQRKKKVG